MNRNFSGTAAYPLPIPEILDQPFKSYDYAAGGKNGRSPEWQKSIRPWLSDTPEEFFSSSNLLLESHKKIKVFFNGPATKALASIDAVEF